MKVSKIMMRTHNMVGNRLKLLVVQATNLQSLHPYYQLGADLNSGLMLLLVLSSHLHPLYD